MSSPAERIIGPILFLDQIGEGLLQLAALFIAPPETTPPPVDAGAGPVAPVCLARYASACVWRARFALPADRPSGYAWNGTRFELASDLRGDLRIAYVSCNGEENGDLDREGAERNAMWARLGEAHRRDPFALLLHGGDQVYADEVTDGHPLSQDWPGRVPADPDPAALASLGAYLRERFLGRYAAIYRAPETAWLLARVPSLMQWDDHDICDGWGSLPRDRTGSAVGQTLYAAAREAFLLFQQATVAGDLPGRFADPAGGHLGWTLAAPGLRLVAPDLRGERGRRNILGPGGRALMEAEAARPPPGHTLLLSSVPLLGPRMSLLEAAMWIVPRMQKYEDDLRDQWQSRAHRDEWRQMLRLVERMAATGGVTALSGEIHLATRAEMGLEGGGVLHQLVASGIAHRPPPRAWARMLGALSFLGGDPLPGRPIRIRPLPGQPHRYTAERNFLTLDRRGTDWSARWTLEQSGPTPALSLAAQQLSRGAPARQARRRG